MTRNVLAGRIGGGHGGELACRYADADEGQQAQPDHLGCEPTGLGLRPHSHAGCDPADPPRGDGAGRIAGRMQAAGDFVVLAPRSAP